ncbi:MAG: hypothetical protein AW12_03119 [Candidatus Accumulibacter sp. BA-94]|nr:MAG: hypothetical protein AW12_03119 [Candidatus Accumulibacter sp. BA-94]
MQRRTVVGASGGILDLCVGRSLGRGDRGRFLGRRRVDELILEEHRFQTAAHMPFNVIGEHAQEDLRPHPLGAVVEDGSPLQIDHLDRTEGALDLRQAFVSGDRGIGRQLVGREAGANHIQPIERRHRRQFRLGRRQQFAALARALLGQQRITTDHQALAGKVLAAQFKEIAFVEQRRQERTVFLRQLCDLWRPQAADPVHPIGLEDVADARRGDHSPIAHPGDLLDREA